MFKYYDFDIKIFVISQTYHYKVEDTLIGFIAATHWTMRLLATRCLLANGRCLKSNFHVQLSGITMSHPLSFAHKTNLCNILSLKTLERGLYQRILDINLDDTEDIDRYEDAYFDYTDIASALICSRDQPLRTLTLLSASPFANSSSLRAWLGEAINRKVEHVNLTFLQHSPTTPIYLHEKILICSTLVP